jgi:hypothetical protein
LVVMLSAVLMYPSYPSRWAHLGDRITYPCGRSVPAWLVVGGPPPVGSPSTSWGTS